MAQWSMLLDSSRSPMYGAIVARSVPEAKRKCLIRGVPENLILEFYLGINQPTGLDFAKWLVKVDQDFNGGFIPKHFTFYVHSQNEEGREAINTLLNDYLEERRNKWIQELGFEDRRDRRSKEYVLEERRKNPPKLGRRIKPSILWGNLDGSDFALHTRNKLIEDKRKH
jgi:hypothetical protein